MMQMTQNSCQVAQLVFLLSVLTFGFGQIFSNTPILFDSQLVGTWSYGGSYKITVVCLSVRRVGQHLYQEWVIISFF